MRPLAVVADYSNHALVGGEVGEGINCEDVDAMIIAKGSSSLSVATSRSIHWETKMDSWRT